MTQSGRLMGGPTSAEAVFSNSSLGVTRCSSGLLGSPWYFICGVSLSGTIQCFSGRQGSLRELNRHRFVMLAKALSEWTVSFPNHFLSVSPNHASSGRAQLLRLCGGLLFKVHNIETRCCLVITCEPLIYACAPPPPP